jgi:negative regulator of flagellin synthesis FlgM
MTINSIGGANPLDTLNKTQRTRNTARPSQSSDTIHVSSEARQKAEAYYLAEIAASVPDVRAELVERIKDKIKDPAYINSAIVESTAAKIIEAYGL